MTILRPTSIAEALHALQREDARPMGSGFGLRARQVPGIWVDLRGLGLDTIREVSGRRVYLGATLPLGDLVAYEGRLPQGLATLARPSVLETSEWARATLGGALMSADGRSFLAAGMMALDATSVWETLDGQEKVPLADVYALRAWYTRPGRFLREVQIPITPRLNWRFQDVDAEGCPTRFVMAARWPRGRTRLVIGGWGDAPYLVFDGPNPDGWEATLASRYQAVRPPDASPEDWELIRAMARETLQALWGR